MAYGLLFFLVHDLRVDHIALRTRRTGSTTTFCTCCTLRTCGRSAGVLVQRLRRTVLRLRQLLHGAVHRRGVVGGDRALQLLDRRFDGRLVGAGELAAHVLQHLLRAVHRLVGLVTRFDLFLPPLV